MTPQQYKLLTFIRNTVVHMGKGPTYAEMREHMEVASSQAIIDWLNILEREEYIKQTGKHRGIELTEKGRKQESLNFTPAEKTSISPFSAGGTISPTQNTVNNTPDISINKKSYLKGGENSGST